ncbi:MAG: CRISPR-associated endonuclease Cas2 [Vicinamibacteria bacterium]|nr:CRISPR-associated endonuclease Cas2 [Vicinamibacteria bacterium]
MTSRYYVTYDICDPRRLRKVFQILKGAGEHVQLSVFCCDLSERQKEALISDLTKAILPSEDQVLFIDLGPTDGVAPERVTNLGQPHEPREPGPVIV